MRLDVPALFYFQSHKTHITVDYKSEKIKPYDGQQDKTGQVEQMFNSIAPAYDFMNHAMTLGIDKLWRRTAVRMIAQARPQRILDVATGTGDFAIDLCRKLSPESIVGFDLTAGMLDVARRKVAKLGLDGVISFKQGNCAEMSDFASDSFDAIAVAFGVRNFEHIEQCYREMLRVLKPGGTLCVIELSVPRNPVIRFFYNLYALHIIPAIGGLKSHDRSAYRYLPLSIAAAPQGEKMLEIMRATGFGSCSCRRLTMGVCTIYTAVK